MNEINKQQFNIDIPQILNVVKKYWRALITCGVIGMLLALLIAFFFITPKYSSSVDLLVNQKADTTQAQFTAQQADLQAINTYKDVLKKSVILEPVLKEIRERDNYQGSLATLQGAISISNEANSQVVSVTVTDANAYVATDIANTIGKVFTQKIKKIMQVNNVTVVNKATVNTTPVSPNKKLFAIIGLLLGISLGVIWAIVKEITDTTVKEIDLLTNELGLTDLGVVYHISDNNKRFRSVNVEDDSNEDEPNNDIRRV